MNATDQYTDKDFRIYVLSLEEHYRKEHERLKDDKPFAAEPERRMMLLCGNIIEHFDKIDT